MRHPNFHSSMATVNPDRPLTDIPEPAPRYQQKLGKLLLLYNTSPKQKNLDEASMWQLIASPELASHLDLLQLGGLINLPTQFFEPKPNCEAKLLSPLTEMSLLDISDIYQVCAKYPTLTRYGFKNNSETQKLVDTKPEMASDGSASHLSQVMPEMRKDWLACCTAVHVLKQCQTRQSINRSLTAKQICQHMRSYVLSQCNEHPQFEKQYRQIRLFEGHVVVAASYLGLKLVLPASIHQLLL